MFYYAFLEAAGTLDGGVVMAIGNLFYGSIKHITLEPRFPRWHTVGWAAYNASVINSSDHFDFHRSPAPGQIEAFKATEDNS